MSAPSDSADKSPDSPINWGVSDPIPLTFGVEIEFLFCHEDANNTAHDWLKVKAYDPPHNDDAQNYIPFYDPYEERIARVLRRHQLPIRVQPYAKSDQNFAIWQITAENFSDLRSNQSLEKWSNGRIRLGEEYMWSTKGLELVSRILPAPPPGRHGRRHESLEEIKKYTAVLPGGPQEPYFSIARPENAGLHVHVGMPQSDSDKEKGIFPRMPLPLLQHLSYLLVQYEDIISSFHHPQRRGYYDTKTDGVAVSNLMGIRKDDHICGSPAPPSLPAIQDMIFAPGMQVEHLIELMCSIGDASGWGVIPATRNKFVNFTRLDYSWLARTVEFRQHGGTLNGDEIGHWVRFVVALVRAAERKMKEGTPPPSPATPTFPSANRPKLLLRQLQWSMKQGPKYHPTRGEDGKLFTFRYQDQDTRTNALFELLQFDRRQVEYWLGRCRLHNLNAFTTLPHYQACPACHENRKKRRPNAEAMLWMPDREEGASATEEEYDDDVEMGDEHQDDGWGHVDDDGVKVKVEEDED